MAPTLAKSGWISNVKQDKKTKCVLNWNSVKM